MVDYIGVERVQELVSRTGPARFIETLATEIETDYRRWREFDKSPRHATHSPVGVIELMPTSDGRLYSFKYVNGHPKNTAAGLLTVTAFGVLADVETGYPLLLSEMTYTTALRTAAMSALAARRMARPASRVMALIGNGAQSEFQAIAFHHMLGIRELRLYDTDSKATLKLERNLLKLGLHGVQVVRCVSTAEAVRGADIVTTVTADKRNAVILTPAMIQPGMHINAVGGDCPGKTELHADILRRPDARVIVEFAPQCRIEGEIQQLEAWSPVTEFSDVLLGKAVARAHDSEVTIFDSVGFALTDFSALRYLYRLNRDQHTAPGEIDLVPDLDDPKDLFGGLAHEIDLTRQPRNGWPASDGSARGCRPIGLMMGRAGRTAALIGAPTDVGAGDRGSSMGPEALRVAGLGAALTRHGLKVIDRGNVNGPPNPSLPPVGGYRHLPEVYEWNRNVHDAVYRDLEQGNLPVLLGGDHSLAIGSISAVARHCRETGKDLRILWLDAHADFNTSDLSPSGNLHGMPLACLCGFGPRQLVQLGGAVPAISPQWIRQVGIRSVDSGEQRFVHEQGLEVFDMRSIDEMGVRQVMDSVLADMDGNTHLHVSFDVDFLDPEIAPGVGTTVPGGPSYREAQLCMEMLADTDRLGSLDVVELNPALDVRNKTATLAVDLLESLFGKSTLIRQPMLERSFPRSDSRLLAAGVVCRPTPASAPPKNQ